MNIRITLLSCILIITSTIGFAQTTGSLKGRIIDQVTKQPVAGASVSIGNKEPGASSDSSGVFTIPNIPVGSYTLTISMIGYQTKSVTDINISANKTYYAEFQVFEDASELQSVTVRAFKGENNPATPVSTFSYSREEIFRNPGAQGDIMRAISVLPGVISAGTQFSAIAARGQGTQDNVYMVDDIPMFNLSHLEAEGISNGFNDPNGGRFSIFAPRVVDNVQFQNGGFDATFGRRSSSYLGLGIKEGNRETTSFSAQLELLGATLIYDGPVTKKTSLFTSARYLNFAGVTNITQTSNAPSISLSDYLVKTTTEINAKNKLSFIAMLNPERVTRLIDDINTDENLNDDNSGGTILYNHRSGGALAGLNLRTLTSTSSYWKNVAYFRSSWVDNNFGSYSPSIDSEGKIVNAITGPYEDDLRSIRNNQQEIGYRSIFTRKFKRLSVTAGVDLTIVNLDYARTLKRTDTIYTFRSTDYRPDPTKFYQVLDPALFNASSNSSAFNGSGYISLSWKVSEKITLNPGLRYDYSGFSEQHVISPRISGNVMLDDRQSLNFASGIYYQDPAYSIAGGQTDGNKIKNERIIQNIIGYKFQFSGDLKLTAEVWHKQFDDLVVQPNRVQSYANNDGSGFAYGADFSLIKRLSRKYYGQISYSYMHSERNDNNDLGDYDYTFNVPHSISLLASYQPNDRWIIATKFRYATGRPIDDFIVHENVLNDPNRLRYSQEITSINSRQFPAFVSFDVRADYNVRMKRSDLTFFLDITNIQNTFNSASELFVPMTGKIVRVGLGVLPTLGVKLEL